MSVRPESFMLQEKSSFEGQPSGVFPRYARLQTLLDALLLIAVAGVLFALHTRWTYTHFSHEGYLLDAGWLA